MPIKELLEDPFGPYPDYRILNPNWPRKGGPITRPILTSVYMKCGGNYIGLDETEFLLEASPMNRTVRKGVQVIGVLVIDRLDWLSETGREWLQYDLRERDNAKKVARKPSQLTLETIYGDGVNSGSKISVWLKFDKILSAAYMTLDDDPKSLVLRGADQNRSFCIQNLDPGTYKLSRNFLERYCLRRLIHELIDGSDTPIQDRNIDWLVNQYLAQVVPMDRYFRIIYHPTGDQSKGDLKLKKPRHSRHVHKAEIREIFARQAEWILADQIASSSPNARYLNISQWVRFVKQVKTARRNARAQGLKWGIPWNRDTSANDDTEDVIDLTQFGGTREDWDRRLRNALANPIPWQQRREIQKTTPKPTPSAAPPVQLAKKLPPQQQRKPESPKPRSRRTISVEYHYDSDFSEGSTPPATDSESDTDSQHDERLAVRVPWYCRVPPTLESTQHVWRCPGCGDYRIDLLQPDEDELEEIPEYYAELLRLKNWSKVTEPDVMMAFGYLVNHHYTGHLKALGIQLVTDDSKVSVRKWPEEKKRKSRRLNKASGSASQRR